jgi:hypothetical protein
MKTLNLLLLASLIALVSCTRKPDLSGVYTYETDTMVFAYDLQSSGSARAKLVMEVFGTTIKNYEGSWNYKDGYITVQVRDIDDQESAKDSIGQFTVEPNGDLLTVKSPEFKKTGIRFVKQRNS